MREDKARQYFALAESFAYTFSKDPNRKVGAIMLAPDSLQILSMGYNGMPRGIKEDNEAKWQKPQKYFFVEHAERNCVYNASRHGTPLQGSIAIVTMFPCADCARALIQAGVKTIVTKSPDFSDPRWGEHFKVSNDMFMEVGMHMILL